MRGYRRGRALAVAIAHDVAAGHFLGVPGPGKRRVVIRGSSQVRGDFEKGSVQRRRPEAGQPFVVRDAAPGIAREIGKTFEIGQAIF